LFTPKDRDADIIDQQLQSVSLFCTLPLHLGRVHTDRHQEEEYMAGIYIKKMCLLSHDLTEEREQN